MFQEPSPDLNLFLFISFAFQLLKQTQTETLTTQGIQVFIVFNVQIMTNNIFFMLSFCFYFEKVAGTIAKNVSEIM